MNFVLYALVTHTRRRKIPPKKRRSPRQKALNRAQAEQQLARYNRLSDIWVAKMVTASKKVEAYRQKLAYYQARVASLAAIELAEMEQTLASERIAHEQVIRDIESQTGRSPRPIELGD